MIKICKQYVTDGDATDGGYSETNHASAADALKMFDNLDSLICVICENPGEHLRLMHGIGRTNALLGSEAMGKVSPGEVASVVVWQCRSEVADGRGWRMIFMREARSARRPAEKKEESVNGAPTEQP